MLGVLVVATGCKVERTPERYFKQASPIEEERQAAGQEVRDRLLAMGQALGRGNPNEALIALSPAESVYVVRPQEGATLSGVGQVDAMLTEMVEQQVPAEISEVEVEVGPRANVAWFRARLDLPGSAPGDRPLRMTGVYVLDAGLWKLVQAHISAPVIPPPAAPPSPGASAADSAAAG